jgi:uncharacterized protein (TIGR02453 family)
MKKNNNTPWMHAHKDEYLEARKEFEFLIQELIVRISHWDSRFEHLEPKQCIFRFNRDIRFSDNKNPYKENFAAYFGIGGKKSFLPGYYISVSPREIFVGGGVWRPEPDKLMKIRRYVARNGTDLVKVIQDKSFKKTYGDLSDEDSLKRIPKGFDADHEYADFLKLKSFIASKDLTVADATAKDFGKKVDKILKDLKPLNEFLEKALKGQEYL